MVRSNGELSGPSELGCEAQLWKMADELRHNLGAAEPRHVVLGLAVREPVSNAFAVVRADLEADFASQSARDEDVDERLWRAGRLLDDRTEMTGGAHA